MTQTDPFPVIQGVKTTNSLSSSPSLGPPNSCSNEVKFPANCDPRHENVQGILGVSYGRGINPAYIDEYSINKPNQDKKIVRITSVVGYILLVSAVAVVLSLYYLFLWNPQKNVKGAFPPRPGYNVTSGHHYGQDFNKGFETGNFSDKNPYMQRVDGGGEMPTKRRKNG